MADPINNLPNQPTDEQLFAYVAQCLQELSNPVAEKHVRRAAAMRLGALPPVYLYKLSELGQWQDVLSLLTMASDSFPSSGAAYPGDVVDEAVDDAGPRQAPSVLTPDDPAPSFAALWPDFRADRSQLEADDTGTPAVVLHRLTQDTSDRDIFEACGLSHVSELQPTEAHVRGAMWASYSPLNALLGIQARWPERLDLHAAAFDAVVTDTAGRGLARRLARSVIRAARNDGTRYQWFQDAWIESDNVFGHNIFTAMTTDAMAQMHWHARLVAARCARDFEFTAPNHVGLLLLMASSSMVRRAAEIDLRMAWHRGSGDPRKALRWLRAAVRSHATFTQRADAAMIRPPSEQAWARLSAGEREVMQYAHSRLASAPAVVQHGLLRTSREA